MKLISLTRGLFAKVDDADFDWLNQWKWQANCISGVWYAKRGSWNPQKRNNDTVMMHSLIAGKGADHRDGDGLNNQRTNLRPANKSQNAMNSRVRKDCQSGVTGVCLDSARKKWTAQIHFRGVTHNLGRFVYFEDAVKARKRAEEKYFGEFSIARSRGVSATINR